MGAALPAIKVGLGILFTSKLAVAVIARTVLINLALGSVEFTEGGVTWVAVDD
jgi:hypothetical protein